MMKQKRSKNPDFFYDSFESPLGTLYLIFSGKELSSIDFTEPSDVPRKTGTSLPIINELRDYFEKGADGFTQKIALIKGTAFEKSVWLALREIPYGETRTYKWLASKLGRPNAARAVGNALGKNVFPILFPCHRIIESDGSLGGYSGGLDIKRKLLQMEYYKTVSSE